ncbi:MAG TPA: FGGY-family carbohydrate kinase, partial [Pirellulales bacterium]|nr:FGGY-family carbohydrate kinase [Pirellulales bacterium]
LSSAAPGLVSLVDPDDPAFLAPVDMPEAIRSYCRRTGQPVPADEGAIIRSALDSLALRYRTVLGSLEQLVGSSIETIHIVGGGSQNQQLCQATADACHRTVLAGPVEATALGNILVQAIAAGDIASVSQARDVVRHSFQVIPYQPRNPAIWDEAYGRFSMLVGKT